MDFGLAGKKALVCAASKGLGRAIAIQLAQEGVELFVCSSQEDALAEVVSHLKSISEKPVHSIMCDLTQIDSRSKLIRSVESVFPTLDILIHNVGGPKPSTVEETSMYDWETGFQRLFMSVVHLNQSFLPGMKAKGWGRIVTVTSGSVVEPVADLAISNAIRSAVTSMNKTLSSEVASHGVTVNNVAPGFILTARTEERIRASMSRGNLTRESILNEYAKSIPAGRLGTPEEFAHAVTFLCSQGASYITGATLHVDGGKRKSTY